MNGVTILLETAFEDFIMEGNRILGIKTNRGDFFGRWVINSAGLYSDEVMHKAGVGRSLKLRPVKVNTSYLIELKLQSIMCSFQCLRLKGRAS